MISRRVLSILVLLITVAGISPTIARPGRDELYSLFSQANEAFRQANSSSARPAQAKKLYEKAILNYEKIINAGQIQNAKLHYNLANAYFLNQDIGRAIVNYKRAELLDENDRNIQSNLAFARSRTIDRFKEKAEQRILQTLFFWHYDFSLKTRFLITCICFAIILLCMTIMVWLGRKSSLTTTTVVAAILFIAMASSVLAETTERADRVCGVIVAAEVVARQGDGANYQPSFKEPLHAGTEFDLVHQRGGWMQIKLPDDSQTWIPQTSAELIRPASEH